VALEVALDRAAQILQVPRSPLIYGLSRSSTEGQRAAVALADRIGATSDTTASLCHAPSVMGLQEAGESTCSLGEVKNRADLVMFWGRIRSRAIPGISSPTQFVLHSVGRSGSLPIIVGSSRTGRPAHPPG
jgi:formylmethanofuran dehydrogenase subunit B